MFTLFWSSQPQWKTGKGLNRIILQDWNQFENYWRLHWLAKSSVARFHRCGHRPAKIGRTRQVLRTASELWYVVTVFLNHCSVKLILQNKLFEFRNIFCEGNSFGTFNVPRSFGRLRNTFLITNKLFEMKTQTYQHKCNRRNCAIDFITISNET